MHWLHILDLGHSQVLEGMKLPRPSCLLLSFILKQDWNQHDRRVADGSGRWQKLELGLTLPWHSLWQEQSASFLFIPARDDLPEAVSDLHGVVGFRSLPQEGPTAWS